MVRKVEYEDCMKYLEGKLKIKFFDYQKEIIKCFCEGKEVRVGRAAGRSFCAKAFGKYISYLYDLNDYSSEPEVIIPCHEASKVGLLTDGIIERVKHVCSYEEFKRDFCSPLMAE